MWGNSLIMIAGEKLSTSCMFNTDSRPSSLFPFSFWAITFGRGRFLGTVKRWAHDLIKRACRAKPYDSIMTSSVKTA